MPIEMHHEGDKTYRLDIRGILSKADIERSEAELASELSRIGSAKLLCVLKEFKGWETPGNWNSLTFYMKHGDAIERIAIVGEERWRSLALMFAVADLRKAPVEFFTEDALTQAREWLSA
jgi:hypothetical protein